MANLPKSAERPSLIWIWAASRWIFGKSQRPNGGSVAPKSSKFQHIVWFGTSSQLKACSGLQDWTKEKPNPEMLKRDSPDVINHPQFLGWVSTFMAHWANPTLVVLATGIGPAGRCRYIFCENKRNICTENLGFCLFPFDCTATLSMKGLMKGIRHAVALLENAMIHLVGINSARKSHFRFVSWDKSRLLPWSWICWLPDIYAQTLLPPQSWSIHNFTHLYFITGFSASCLLMKQIRMNELSAKYLNLLIHTCAPLETGMGFKFENMSSGQ